MQAGGKEEEDCVCLHPSTHHIVRVRGGGVVSREGNGTKCGAEVKASHIYFWLETIQFLLYVL